MKATLEFTDGFEFRCAINGRNMLLVLNALDREMRGCVKHEHRPYGFGEAVTPEEVEVVVGATSHWRTRLRHLAEDYHVDLEDDYDF